ncbi:hypothetical protein PR048_027330 [Dryococelus australis]|uniref:Uncharacterized protein n=1 Tax=Dryococelus australis TaxID=614101 RepID=A0ABQ9GF67_9NEOP|nr:hypothetical protein PR048_027330 [Dryococelus australis]
MQGRGKLEIPERKPTDGGIVRHDSHWGGYPHRAIETSLPWWEPPTSRPVHTRTRTLNGCVLREAKNIIKFIVNASYLPSGPFGMLLQVTGKYHMPTLEPFFIQELKVDQDSGAEAIGFSFVATDFTLAGLSGIDIRAAWALTFHQGEPGSIPGGPTPGPPQVGILPDEEQRVDIFGWLLRGMSPVSGKVDLKEKHVAYELQFPRVEAILDYEADGKLLRLPIKGRGSANVTVVDAKALYSYNYTLEKRDDGDYVVIADSKLTVDAKALYSYNYTLEKRDDGDYVVITDSKLTVDAKALYSYNYTLEKRDDGD